MVADVARLAGTRPRRILPRVGAVTCQRLHRRFPQRRRFPAISDTRTAHEAELEERLRQMEALIKKMPDPEQVRRLEERLRTLPDPEHVRQLESTVRQLSTQVDQLSTRLRQAEARRPASPNGTSVGPGMGSGPAGTSGLPAAGAIGLGTEPGGTVAEEVGFGATAAGFGPAAELPSSRFDMPAVLPNVPAISRWGPGFQMRTADDEFDIQFHDLTELDGRFYGIPNQNPVSDTFDIARNGSSSTGT